MINGVIRLSTIPEAKSELTFKGDFWVNDTTYAIKKINLEVTKSANLNWVKEVYIEQDFDVVNDSVFLLKPRLYAQRFQPYQEGGAPGGFTVSAQRFTTITDLI